MAERLIQQRFLRATRQRLAGLINLLPADKRLLVINELREKNYPSALRYFMRKLFPTWRDVMIEDFTQSILHDFNAIKNARRDITEGGYAQYAARGIVFRPLSRHQEASERLIRTAFFDARPSGVNVVHEKTCGKTRVIDIVSKNLSETYKIAVSPGYSHFAEKIGTRAHRHYVILSGYLVMKPFDGVEVWCCEVADTRRRMQRSVYIGRCSHGRYGSIYTSHARLGACLLAIEDIAAGRALNALKT